MRLRGFLILVLLLIATPLAAQDADVITGRVVDGTGRPVVGARVEAISAETEISRSVLTDTNGRYMMIFPDGGGRYLLRITFIGMAEILRTLVREADEELLVADATMSTQAIQLEGLTARGQRPPPGAGNAGEQSTQLPQELVNRLPLPDLDPNTLALLSAGVIGTSADSLTGRMGFSIAGMSELLNQITLDGMMLGEGEMGVPEEGIRRTQVTTSTFDASRGGFAGGEVSMTSARGANRTAGSLSYRLDDDALQMNSNATTNAFTRHNLGASIGGPIVRNRLFYNASFQLARNVNHRFALTPDDPLAAERSGVSVDSIGRFVDILGTGYGLPIDGTGPYNQLNDDLRLQGRIDWNLLQGRSTSQTLSARFNLNVNDQDSTRINTLDLAQHGGETERESRSAALTLTSRLGGSWTNALRLSLSENFNDAFPFIELPEGQVRVTSEFEDGTRNTRNLVFGGNRSMPSEAYSRNLQLGEDLSFLLPIGAQLHRLKVGGSLQKSRNVSRSTDNLYGTFTFASLDDFDANAPERFERALTPRESRTGTLNAGLYFGDTWRVSQPLEITLGLRWDRSRLDQKPDRNPAIEEAFGRRTDIDPVSTGLSPRLGFSYRFNAQGQPTKALSGGVGLFAGRAPTSIFSAAVRQTGLPGAEQRLICIGDAVPVPDWDLYLQDPAAIPGECADGEPGIPDALSSRAPTVTLINTDQSLPSSLRFDLGYRTRLPLGLNGNFRYNYSRGSGLWGYRDLNLNESQTFMLHGEDRLFFGDPSAIVEETGAVSMVASRLYPEFGNVFDVTSSLRSASHQVSSSVNGVLFRRLTFNVNHTLAFARDQGSGSFSAATTAGNPNESEWNTSGNDRRHSLNLILSYPLSQEVEITAMTRLQSGTPFTPLVNRDINGDGSRNDRAFVFDPATADPETAAAMQRLLASVPARVESCLRSQLGRIAERNSCRNGWSESLDLRLGVRPNLPQLGRRVTISLDGRNILTGLDQLVHGRDGMKGWGEGQRADATLLEVRGFDPIAQRFDYEVNEGFGQTRRGPNAFRNAFSLTLSARVTVGGQPIQSNRGFGPIAFTGVPGGDRGGFAGAGGLRGGPGGMGGGFGGMGEIMGLFRQGADPASADSLLAAAMPNPLVAVLARADSLGLGPDQRSSLQTISDTLDTRLAARREALIPLLASLAAPEGGRGQGAGAGMLQRFQSDIQPQIQGAEGDTRDALAQAQRVLTPEQWQALPESVRAIGDAQPRRGAFNAVGMIDRLLANPIPVLLELKDTLALSPDQVTRTEAVSAALHEKLNARRESLGKRFDNVEGGQQARIFQELQPEIEATRREITDALKQVEGILTTEQWSRVPEAIRNPFQAGRRGR